jgi:peptidoglycan/LPS O-acetylase OafA/YrhL
MGSVGGQSSRIAGFDGLRALAVLSVVSTHYGVFAGLEGHAIFPLVHGTTGVRAFFVLSGFLITSLLLRESDKTGGINYANFLMRRALRIFPLYILFLISVSGLYLAGWWKTDPNGLTYAWLYVYNFVPPRLYDPLLAHTWSLAVEEHFYLLWPLALTLLLRNRKTMVWWIVCAAAVSLVSMVALTRWVGLHGFFLDRWTPVAAFSLLVGCMAAVTLQERSVIAARCARWPGLVAAASLFALPALIKLSDDLDGRFLPGYLAVSLQSVGIAAFLLWLVENQSGKVAATLEWSPLKYIGTISYGIYIWQGFFLGVSPDRLPDSPWPPNPTLGLLGLALLAPLSYHFFEKPFLAIKTRFSSAPAAPLLTEAPVQ